MRLNDLSFFMLNLVVIGMRVYADTQNNLDEFNIFMNITKNYNKNIRPASQVGFGAQFSLKQIMAIDEKNQIMTSNSYLGLKWTDNRLMWNPTYFNNLTGIYMPANLLWTVDMFVINTADTNGYITMPSQSLAYVSFDGVVYVVLSLTSLKTRCKISIKYYPFDTQNCSVW